MKTVDVVVVGAGPAGCSAALTLHDHGLRVVVIDKAEFPRDKCCGDGLTTSALRQLERMGLDPSDLPSWRVVEKTAWRSPSGFVSELSMPDESGIRIAVAKREELDNALLALVRRAGITVHENSTLDSVDTEPSGRAITASAGDHVFSCRYIIAADGMWSPTRKLVEPTDTPYLGNIHAFRQYFENVTGPARDRLFVSFEPDLLPGYLWSFPLGGGRVNVGFGIERRDGRSIASMKQTWADILERDHIRAELGADARPEAPHKAWPIPASIETALLTAADGRVFFVGDAARVVDPLTGEGIGQALETAREAAMAIVLHGNYRKPRAAAEHYTRVVRRGMAIDNSVAGEIAKLVRSERVARSVIRMTPYLNRLDHYAIRWVFEDNPRAAALTPWRWRERFSGPKPAAYIDRYPNPNGLLQNENQDDHVEEAVSV